MSQWRGRILAIAAGLVFLFGLLAGLVITKMTPGAAQVRAINTTTILREVQTLSELVTVKYVMEKIVILEAPPESVLGQMFAGDNRVLLLAHGIVKAGVNMAELEEGDIRVEDKTVRINLPRSRITDAYLEESKTQVIERTTGLFRSFDKNLEQSARQNAVDDIRRSARVTGILKDADERARAQLSALLKSMDLSVEFVSERERLP